MYFIVLILFYFATSQPDINALAKEQIEQNLKIDQKMKILQSDSVSYTWGPIRIQSYFVSEVYDTAWTDYVQKVLDVAIAFFGKNLMVRQRNSKLTIGSTNLCIDVEIPTKYQNVDFDADLVFFTQIVNDEQSGYLAYAGPCKINLHDNRPVFGVISWNMHYVDLVNPTNLKFENSVSTAIHEMIHGLGFIQTMYSYYIQHSSFTKYTTPTYRDNLARLILNTTRLSTLSKNYFECYNAEGVVMENQGSSGTADSHFERIIFYNELMTGSAMNSDFQISDFTYTLLEDTGFYRLSSYNPDPIIWGKGRGCDFIQKSCQLSNFPEFCTGKSLGCSYERNGMGSCIADQLSDSCQYYSVNKGMDCRDPSNTPQADYTSYFSAVQAYFGFNGNCFKSSVKQSSSENLAYELGYSCYKMICNDDGSVSVSIGSQSYDCSKNGTVIKASGSLTGELTCPSNVQEICYGKDDCENQCSGRGICVNKVCICAKGYGGKSCENVCLNYREGDSNNCVVGCAKYSNEQTKQCIECSAHCKTCTAINVCTECQSGYTTFEQTLGSATGTFCEPLIVVQDGAGLINPWLKSEYLLLIGLIQLIFM